VGRRVGGERGGRKITRGLLGFVWTPLKNWKKGEEESRKNRGNYLDSATSHHVIQIKVPIH